MDFLQKLTDGSFMPHGHCLLWRGDLLFLHVVGDVFITFSYLVIPIALIIIVHRREDFVFNWVFQLFATFIFLCGLTHLISIINVWNGYYYIAGYTKFITGLVSLVTAYMVWRLLPKAIAFPSNEQLRQNNEKLLITRKLLEQRTLELERLSIIDPLTGINNRRELMKALKDQINRHHRQPHNMCLLMIDLDNFKSINDQFGHAIGDQVLIDTVSVLEAVCRKVDVISRYGGEEFVVLLPDTDLAQGMLLAERICQTISERTVDIGNGKSMRYTCSIGVAQYWAEQTKQQWLICADNALYEAKHKGKNRCCAAADWQPS